MVMGAQWGDEGKGKLTDILSADSDFICRYNGGANAGHTIVHDKKQYKLNLLPSGILNEGCINVIGNGVVVHLPQLFKELEQLDVPHEGRVLLSDRAHLLFDLHQVIDGMQEQSLGKNEIGTTRRGIGPCYMTKAERIGIRVGDLAVWDSFELKFRNFVAKMQQRYGNFEYDTEKELQFVKAHQDRILSMTVDTVTLINKAIDNGKRVLLEGANAHMLDLDFGTYPYVTSSSPIAGGACTGLGLPPSKIGEVYGVVKAYTTRVGAGPFPTELHDANGEHLQRVGHEFGTTTGRSRRCGWLDMPVLQYSHMINDYAAICLTKLDVLSGLKELKIGVEYVYNGTTLESIPQSLDVLSQCEVVYETLTGWDEDISMARTFSDLPRNCQIYVRRVEELLGCKIRWIGVGPDRNDMIVLEDGVLAESFAVDN